MKSLKIEDGVAKRPCKRVHMRTLIHIFTLAQLHAYTFCLSVSLSVSLFQPLYLSLFV